MIVDAHVHAFPHHGGASGYKDASEHRLIQQASIGNFWGRMVTNTLDEEYKPRREEEIDFRVGKYGKYYWTKNGHECWLQRFPPIMVEMEWPPEQMIAFMDNARVDVAVLQSGYMEMNYCRRYFTDIIKRWPDRFIGTVTIDYDINKGDGYREREIQKMRDSVLKDGMRGVFQGYPREQNPEDSRFDPLWSEMSNLGIPHFFWTGFTSRALYLKSLERIVGTLKKFPNLIGIIGHLGGNIRPRSSSEFTDTPSELFHFLRLPNAYFEVGYVLAYENWDIWGDNYEYPYSLHTELIRRVYDEVGPERLLFGSDMPNIYRTCTYQQCMDTVRLHFDFLNEEEKALILGGNATRVFKL